MVYERKRKRLHDEERWCSFLSLAARDECLGKREKDEGL